MEYVVLNVIKILILVNSFLFGSVLNAQLNSSDEFVLENFLAEDYEQIVKVAEDITSKSPIKDYHYIGIGRSPTPIIAYLQTQQKTQNSATNFPISKFRYDPLLERHSVLSEIEEQALNMYFKDQLGFLSGQGKKIVFIDYSDSGISLRAVKTYYDKFREQNPNMPEATVHFIIRKKNSGIRRSLKRKLGYKPKHTIIKGSLADSLMRSKYDAYGINDFVFIGQIYDSYIKRGIPIANNRNIGNYRELIKVMNLLNNGQMEPKTRSCQSFLSIKKAFGF